jgi:hypothetical protein
LRLCLQAARIARRTSAHLQAPPAEFAAAGDLEHPFFFQPSSLNMAHPLDTFSCLVLQPIKLPDVARSTTSPRTSPAGALLLIRKQSTTLTTQVNWPSASAHRPRFLQCQGPPEQSAVDPQSRYLAAGGRRPNPR